MNTINKSEMNKFQSKVDVIGYAFLVGISEYTSPFEDLPLVKKDIEIMKEFLSDHGYEGVIVLDKNNEEIDREFTEFKKMVLSGNVNSVFIYLSGHGKTVSENNDDTYQFIGSKGESISFLNKKNINILSMDVKNVIICIDTCMNKDGLPTKGLSIDKFNDSNVIFDFARDNNHVVFYNKKADKKGNSVLFSKLLADELRRKIIDDKSANEISFMVFMRFIDDNTTYNINEKFGIELELEKIQYNNKKPDARVFVKNPIGSAIHYLKMGEKDEALKILNSKSIVASKNDINFWTWVAENVIKLDLEQACVIIQEIDALLRDYSSDQDGLLSAKKIDGLRQILLSSKESFRIINKYKLMKLIKGLNILFDVADYPSEYTISRKKGNVDDGICLCISELHDIFVNIKGDGPINSIDDMSKYTLMAKEDLEKLAGYFYMIIKCNDHLVIDDDKYSTIDEFISMMNKPLRADAVLLSRYRQRIIEINQIKHIMHDLERDVAGKLYSINKDLLGELTTSEDQEVNIQSAWQTLHTSLDRYISELKNICGYATNKPITSNNINGIIKMINEEMIELNTIAKEDNRKFKEASRDLGCNLNSNYSEIGSALRNSIVIIDEMDKRFSFIKEGNIKLREGNKELTERNEEMGIIISDLGMKIEHSKKYLNSPKKIERFFSNTAVLLFHMILTALAVAATIIIYPDSLWLGGVMMAQIAGAFLFWIFLDRKRT